MSGKLQTELNAQAARPFVTRKVWIVEIKFSDTGWMTTVGIGLNRDDAREKARQWREKNGCITRVRQYGYVAAA